MLTKMLLFLLLASHGVPAKTAGGPPIPSSKRSEEAIAKVRPGLEKALAARGLAWGAPVFIRIFKASSELELWVKGEKAYALFRTYPICAWSGVLGPKTKQGDGQSPEGFYISRPGGLLPWSQYHLGFFINYPNAYDRKHKRTGGEILVHGKCVSAGCYAMTDPKIDEIYAMVEGAFRGGQPFVRVHSFPFRMTKKAMEAQAGSAWIGFWKNLKEGYDRFESKKVPPVVTVGGGRYLFGSGES